MIAVGAPQHRLREKQVARAAHRQELGGPLEDSQQYRLEYRQRESVTEIPSRAVSTAFSITARIRSTVSRSFPSNRRTSAGCVFAARTSPPPPSKRARTPSTSITSRACGRTISATLSATRNLISSGHSTRLAGVATRGGRSGGILAH